MPPKIQPKIKKGRKKPVTIQLHDDVHEAGKKRAESLSMSFQEYIAQLIKHDLGE